MSALASALREIVVREFKDGTFSGICLIRRGDDVLVHEAFGVAHRGFGIPNTIETRFDIASVTKLFTAVAIMQLIEHGDLALDARVMPLLGIGGTRIVGEVTVLHLLTHTSGIADDADEEAGEDYEALFADSPNYRLRETVDFLPNFVHKPPVFAPGTGVRYNNCAFVLLGLVIERLTGMTYRDYVREHIFARAGMTGADFCAMDSVHPNFAEHYKAVDLADGTKGWRKNIYSYPPIGSPDGGATVTARDLDAFFRAIDETTLVSEASRAQLFKPRVDVRPLPSGRQRQYGFGFEFQLADDRVAVIEKDGFNAGVRAEVSWLPETGTTCIVIANQDCRLWPVQEALIAALLDGGPAA